MLTSDGRNLLFRFNPPNSPPDTSCTHVLTTEGAPASCGLYWWESLIPPSKPSAEATFPDKLLLSPQGQPLSPLPQLCWVSPWHSARGSVLWTVSSSGSRLHCHYLTQKPSLTMCPTWRRAPVFTSVTPTAQPLPGAFGDVQRERPALTPAGLVSQDSANAALRGVGEAGGGGGGGGRGPPPCRFRRPV